MRYLFLLFVVMPVLELWLLLKVGGIIGATETILLVFVTAIVGSWLLRREGVSTLLRARQKMAASQMPANEMIEGLLLAVAGALLLTPGFITDMIGGALLIYPIRFAIASYLKNNIAFAAVGAGNGAGYQQQHFHSQGGFQNTRSESSDNIIEGDFESIDETKKH